MASELVPRCYKIDPATLAAMAEIRIYLESIQIPGTPAPTDIAALRFAIHATAADLRKRPRKKSG